ncbi:MAG: PQQ-dependent sugar dehydrogenase, partial [Verrucomicrobia bacterium]|nr:PQQ-dependent sugar dehydrogenase [Verrucomicrobiota bacterium]
MTDDLIAANFARMIMGRFSSCAVLVLSLLPQFTGSALALTRVPNTTIQVPLQPQNNGFAVEDAFGTVTFSRPVAMATPPGETNRVFVLEQSGVISVITNLASPSRTVFMDLTDRVISGATFSEHGLLGLAFHPQYASNGWLYVFYTGNTTTTAGSGLHDIVARFDTASGNSNQGVPGSEIRLIVQRDEADNHNGGCLKFGPDGYLYISLGDEGGANDQFGNSQKIDGDFFSGILRIDVDKRPGSLSPNPHAASTTNYAVPPDNPFVGATNFNGSAVNPGNVRTEFWAVGLRNPWRMSFDPATGLLYAGDVGQSSREEVDVIVKGGNYGWAYREGTIQRPGSPLPPPGFEGLEPLLDYPWGFSGEYQGRAVTGGVVYRGTKIASLYGAYVFGDNATGNIWSLRHQGTNVTAWTRLTGVGNPTAFGTDPRNGDVLIAPLITGRLQRLIATSATGDPPPATLKDTGVFGQLETLTPNAGVVPYELNLAFWSDNAVKRRWFSVPDTNQFITFTRDANWMFPTGTVWIKHFELELTNGVPASRHRLETRLLVKNGDGVHGFTYRWGTSTSNALLVTEAGLDETFVIDDGGGLLRTQVWHYPSRSECLACHTAAGGFGLGFNTPQLNRSANMGAGIQNQVRALSEAGYFSAAVSNL